MRDPRRQRPPNFKGFSTEQHDGSGVAAHGRSLQTGLPGSNPARNTSKWLGAVEVPPHWPDWVRDLLSGPIVCDVPRNARGDVRPVLTAVVTVTTRSVTS